MKKIGEIMRTMGRALHLELTEHRSTFLVYSVLRIAVIVTMVLQFLNRNYENVFLCLLTLLLLVLPGFLQMTFRIELPKVLEIIILVFIFSAEILGEINEFYLKFPYWDTVLHTMNGFLAAAIGFSLVDLLNRNKKVGMSLSPVFVELRVIKPDPVRRKQLRPRQSKMYRNHQLFPVDGAFLAGFGYNGPGIHQHTIIILHAGRAAAYLVHDCLDPSADSSPLRIRQRKIK